MDIKNKEAWNQNAYEAWVNRFGTPSAYSEKIVDSPSKLLAGLIDYFGDVKGKKILNLMGSNGNKAVALALLGADVTVVDFSKENAQYANDLAQACGVKINYEVKNIFDMDPMIHENMYDIIFAEMGILHYFENLEPFYALAHAMLKSEGYFLVKDFHPISTKLIVSKGSTAKVRKHKVEGDYFSTELVKCEVAYGKYTEATEKEYVFLRQWTLGEIVTSAARAHFFLCELNEAPNASSAVFDSGIPKTFTLLLKKI